MTNPQPHVPLPSPRRKSSNRTEFLKNWLRQPLRTGAVVPSSRALARLMTSYVPLGEARLRDAAVLELGPGTGVVTQALLDRGVPEENLVLAEYAPEFCGLLAARFPKARIVQGDAYRPDASLERAIAGRRVVAVVSSLPLLTRPEGDREAAVAGHLGRMAPGFPFIQFTYAPGAPVDPGRIDAEAKASSWIKLNLPPARVFVYRMT